MSASRLAGHLAAPPPPRRAMAPLLSRFSADSAGPGLRQGSGVGYRPIDDIIGRAKVLVFPIGYTTRSPGGGFRTNRFLAAVR